MFQSSWSSRARATACVRLFAASLARIYLTRQQVTSGFIEEARVRHRASSTQNFVMYPGMLKRYALLKGIPLPSVKLSV